MTKRKRPRRRDLERPAKHLTYEERELLRRADIAHKALNQGIVDPYEALAAVISRKA